MKCTYHKMIAVLCVVVLTGMTGSALFAAQQSPPSSGVSQPIQTSQWPDVKSLERRIVLQYDGDHHESIHVWTDKVEPHPPVAGAQYRVLILYRYHDVPDDRSISIKVELDNALFEEQAVILRGTGNSAFVGDFITSNRWTATPGTHNIKVVLDSKNEMAEGPVNETNNTFTVTFNVPFPRMDIKPPLEKNINPVIPRAR